MKIRFLDLSISSEDERRAMHDCLQRLMESGQFVMGDEIRKFESEAALACGSRHALAVGSGTGALMNALMALGIGPGDEVITSSMSFAASANAISMVGAVPVLADIGDDLNLDTNSVERVATVNTRAIMPVHYGGLVANMPRILEVAKVNGWRVVEDASQAFGARIGDRFAGTFGDAGCISQEFMQTIWRKLLSITICQVQSRV